MTVALFGPIVTGDDVERATIAALKWWLPTYLREMERRTGRTAGSLEMPFSWSTVNRFSRLPPNQLPAAIVVSPGLAAKPERRGTGDVDAWWRIGAAVVVKGADQEDANERAKLYGAAIRTLVLQHPALMSDLHTQPFASAVEFVDEAYDAVPADYLPIGAAVEVSLNVQVAAIANTYGGPGEPDPAPADWPTVAAIDDITITIEKETIL